MPSVNIFNSDCLDPNNKFNENSIDLIIADPPFGLGESKFDRHYNRDDQNVLQGYQEAPEDYGEWTFRWMEEAKRVLHANGSMYVIMGHTNLVHVLNAGLKLGFDLINHCIWKFNFGVFCSRKFVTSHYHVLYYAKPKAKRTFNTNCRFASDEKENGRSLLYRDMEDVFIINKEYKPGEIKNQNKLPEALIEKLILYPSNEGDTIMDPFLGNFTSAYVALRLNRNICGYEINKTAYDYHMAKLCPKLTSIIS